MKKLLSLLIVTLFTITAWAKNAPAISQQAFIEMQKTNTPAIVLDVRSAREYADGHIKGAINISHTDLPDRLAELMAHKDQTIVVYCRSGRRAGIAETLLAENGFTKLKHLDGDMNGWLKAELPVEK